MYSRLREQFSTAALILSAVALVFALMGGAYAASQASKKTKVVKGARGPRGLTGKEGAAGAKGDTGAAGANGAKGDPGSPGGPGEKGEQGLKGENGKSAKVTSIPVGVAACNELGGAEVKVEPEAGQKVCNGKQGIQGIQGEEGDPWTAGGTLPSGAMERGVWAFNGTPGETEGGGDAFAPISFTIPLASGLFESQVHIEGDTDFEDFCEGSPGEGKVKVGVLGPHMCLWTSLIVGATIRRVEIIEIGLGERSTNEMGAVVRLIVTDPQARAIGSWAVRG
jgi:hypothetical protein